MNSRTIHIALAILILFAGALPVAAQNSPAGGLAAGNVVNRDVDTYMMVNFAPFLNYDKFFTFFQASMYNSVLQAAGSPGFQAGYATKVGGGFMNFFLNTSGFSLNDSSTKTNDGTDTLENSSSTGNLNLQFDTIYGTNDLGTFKLGLNFANVGQVNSLAETSSDDYVKTNSKTGTLATSLEYGKNFIHSDFSMLLAGGKVTVRFPMGGAKAVTETRAAGATTTETVIDPQNAYSASFPNLDLNNVRLDIAPQMWYFFTPQLEPMLVISHIYLVDTYTMMFFPDEIYTEERAGASNGYIRRDHNYLANNLFGYYNRQYSVSSRFSFAWRVNLQAAFYYDKRDHSFTRDPGGAELEDKKINEALWLTVNVAPRLAFSYQAIPGTLVLNGAVVINPLGGTTAIGWQLTRSKVTEDNGNEKITVSNNNTFTGINPVFSLGAAWNLSPFLILEGGASISAAGAGNPLSDVSVAVVYKR
ncbi:MAG: hypothetical protein FWH38_03080 [Treponema sp.]|nr:hypothetical protein [Treponema sp.]